MQEQKHKRLTTKRDQTQLHGCPYVNNLGVGRGGGVLDSFLIVVMLNKKEMKCKTENNTYFMKHKLSIHQYFADVIENLKTQYCKIDVSVHTHSSIVTV